MPTLGLYFLFATVLWHIAYCNLAPTRDLSSERPTCVVPAKGDGTDDSPAILSAFHDCGHGGHISFTNTTYNVATVMNTTELSDCQIDIHGTLLWSKDTTYWLNNSLKVGYQNQSTVWFLGGRNLSVNGYGYGTFDGNGQTWYDLVDGISNYPDRPMGLTIWNARDSVFQGLRFVQSQMWTMAIMKSENVLLQDIYVNSTSFSNAPSRNTDGADTIWSDNITFRRWTVDNGDDAISPKANSTNILVEDCTFYTGSGFALGSIGQYAGVFETIENVTARNITFVGTRYAGYVKTWTGVQTNYPPNGGGGGLGFIKNITLTKFTMVNTRAHPISFTQCTSFSGATGGCDTSLFKISDISFTDIKGTISGDIVANMQCSAAAGGCDRIRIEDIDVHNTTNPTVPAWRYLCSNVHSPIGFECTGNVTDNDGGY